MIHWVFILFYLFVPEHSPELATTTKKKEKGKHQKTRWKENENRTEKNEVEKKETKVSSEEEEKEGDTLSKHKALLINQLNKYHEQRDNIKSGELLVVYDFATIHELSNPKLRDLCLHFILQGDYFYIDNFSPIQITTTLPEQFGKSVCKFYHRVKKLEPKLKK